MVRIGILLLFFSSLSAHAHDYRPETDRYNAYRWPGDQGQSWYEWWYYKVVLPEQNKAYLFTYGIINPWDTEQTQPASRAFVSAGKFQEPEFIENRFSPKLFSARRDTPHVEIGTNEASAEFLRGSLTRADGTLFSWDLSMEHDWRFNAMGWGMFFPGISNIFWYPAQASARMTGWIRDGNEEIRVDRAPAYQDRNWGRTFPSWWTWLVSNHFENSPGTVLAAGGGRPKIFSEFELFDGLCIGLRHHGKTYHFRTSEGDPMNINVHMGHWEVVATNKSFQRIRISADAPRDHFLLLPFGTPDGSSFYDYEALQGTMRVELDQFDLRAESHWRPIARLTTKQAGIEYGSPNLQEMQKAIPFASIKTEQ